MKAYFLKRVDKSQEKAKAYCIKSLKVQKNFYKDALMDYADIRFIDKNQLNPKEIIAQIQVIDRQIRMVKKGLCQKAIWNRQPGYYIDGAYYVLLKKVAAVESNEEKIYKNLKEACEIVTSENMYYLFEKFFKLHPQGLISIQ